MRVLLIVGTQLRHQYLFATLARELEVVGAVEYRRTLVQPPKLPGRVFPAPDLDAEKRHLERLASSERAFFAERVNTFDKSSIPILEVADAAELNSPKTASWVEALRADVMLDYGSGIIRSPLMEALPEWKINLHGGLSPYFKGSATLFWPFYLQQPELAGATFHRLEHRIDGGDILQHVRPGMRADDAVTDIMTRCIAQAAEVAVRLLRRLEAQGDLQRYPQKGTGKLFLERDYKPGCVPVLERLMASGMIARYLEHKEEIDGQYAFVDQLDS